MHIELRKLQLVASLSHETACYSAEIWIDGSKAFLASNRGSGGADDFHPTGTVTEDAVNAWLAANRPASRLGDSVLPHCLEFEVAALITRATETKRLRAQCRTKLVTIEDGKVFTYALKGRALDDVRARVLAARPTSRIVNGDETALAAAIDTLIAVDDRDSA